MTKKEPDQTPNEAIKFPQSVLKPVKNFLQKEQKSIQKKLQALKGEDPFANEERVNNNASPDTDAEEQFGHMKNQAIQNELKKRLIQIRKALSKIKIGTYGTCEKCDQMIDTDRLVVYPEATVCVDCQKEEKE